MRVSHPQRRWPTSVLRALSFRLSMPIALREVLCFLGLKDGVGPTCALTVLHAVLAVNDEREEALAAEGGGLKDR